MDQPRTLAADRRRFLSIVGATAAAGSGFATAVEAQDSDAASIRLEQDGRCVPVEPLAGDAPVEEFYDYRYPTDRFEGPPGSEGSTYSSHGTTDLQRDDTSILYFYDGPEGLSLVLVHGNLDGSGSGGTIRFTLDGLPASGEWVVRDDYYLRDGEPVASNFDRWDVDGEDHVVDWAYRGGRTDGGVFRGLGADFEVHIDPAFNDAAPLAAEHGFGPVERWEVLSGDRDAPERRSLRLDRPVTLTTGDCPTGGTGGTDGDARIVDVSVADGVYAVGEEVTAEVTVENTGSGERTFYVGFSVFGPDGEGRHDDRTTDEPITVASGETTTKTVTWRVERDAPSGTYDAQVNVWRDRVGDDLRGRLDGRRIESAFQVAGGDANGDDRDGDGEARIARLSVADGVYTVGEDVPAEVTVENTGSSERTFYVGYSVKDPAGEGRHNDGTTDEPVTVPADGTKTKTVTWTVEGDAPTGVYDAVVILWRDRAGDDLQGQLDVRRVESAFQVVD